MRLLRSVTSSVLVVVILIQATGCTSWKTVSLSVAAVENPGKKVKVELKEGGTVTSDSVRARGDTVVTYQGQGVGAIPMANVRAVKVHRSNPGATIALILGLGAAAWVALGVMVRAAD